VLAQFPSAELAVRAATMLSNGYVQRYHEIRRVEHLRIGVHLADVAVAADGDFIRRRGEYRSADPRSRRAGTSRN
jgi:hypothetical protein